MGDKWTLLIIRDLAAGPRRFVELQRILPGISTEQLRSRLNRMVADGMLTRQRYREVPPRVDYELTERSRDLMPILGELARWGYDWSWGVPRPGERIDVSAIFRVAPGLLRDSGLEGTIELTVTDQPSPLVYTITLNAGSARVSESPAESADVQVSGDTSAWVEALAPGGERSALSVSGDAALAEAVLDRLGPGVSAERVAQAGSA